MHTHTHTHTHTQCAHTHTTHTCTHTHNTHMHIHSKVSLVNECTLMYFAFLQKQSVSINSAAERVRITLKEIGTLTYACHNADDLILTKGNQVSFPGKVTYCGRTGHQACSG